MIATADATLQEFIEQSQRSIIHRGILAIESFVAFAVERINAGLLPLATTGTFNRSALITHTGTTGASAVLIAYTQSQDERLSARLTRRIRRMMHHTVDLRPFQATVRFVVVDDDDDDDNTEEEDNTDEDQEEDEQEGRTTPQEMQKSHGRISSLQRNRNLRQQQHQHQHQQRRNNNNVATRTTRTIRPPKKRTSARSRTRDMASPLLVMYTPMSFPPSPGARRALLSDFSSATENLLQKASAILEAEAKERRRLSGGRSLSTESRNVSESGSASGGRNAATEAESPAAQTPGSTSLVLFGAKHSDIALACGGHGVTLREMTKNNDGGGREEKEEKEWTTPSVRSSMPVSTEVDANVYYEYHVSHLSSAKASVSIGVGLVTDDVPLDECVAMKRNGGDGGNGGGGGSDRCGVVFSTLSSKKSTIRPRAKPPSALASSLSSSMSSSMSSLSSFSSSLSSVPSSLFTLSLSSSNCVIKLGDTIGVLVNIRRSPNQETCTVTTHFSVNGRALNLKDSMSVKTNDRLWPSLTLRSNVFVLGLFCASDLRYPPETNDTIVSLDGQLL